MGCHENIGFDKFPKQSDWLQKRVEVLFFYDTSQTIKGTIVRDDREEPFQTIIKLNDGRYVHGTECQYSLVDHV